MSDVIVLCLPRKMFNTYFFFTIFNTALRKFKNKRTK